MVNSKTELKKFLGILRASEREREREKEYNNNNIINNILIMILIRD
jgi:hypothetical protein